MAVEKIKIRNLDDELVTYLKGLESVSTSGYNDAEVRLDIASLKKQKADKAELENYQLKTGSVTEAFVTQSVKSASDKLETEISSNVAKINSDINLAKKEITDMVSAGYIQNKNNVINESHLSRSLQSKINGSSSGETADLTEVYDKLAFLEAELNQTEAKFIPNKENSVAEKNLASAILEKINHARSINELIKTEDLSPSVLELINNGGMELSESQEDAIERAVMFFNSIAGGEPGSVLMVTDNSDGSSNIAPEYILMQSCIIVEESSMVNELKSLIADSTASYEDAPAYYIIDIEASKAYLYYPYENSYVFEEIEDKTPTEIIVGKFVLAYKTGNIYFGIDKANYKLIFDKADIDRRFTALHNELITSDAKIQAVENALISANERITSLEADIAALKEFKIKYEGWLEAQTTPKPQ